MFCSANLTTSGFDLIGLAALIECLIISQHFYLSYIFFLLISSGKPLAVVHAAEADPQHQLAQEGYGAFILRTHQDLKCEYSHTIQNKSFLFKEENQIYFYLAKDALRL